MRKHSLICLAAGVLLAIFIGAAQAQSRLAPGGNTSASPDGSTSGEQNVRESRQYEALVCSNPAFRAKRIAQECDPITDPKLHESCLASFNCGKPERRSNKAPPSMTVH